MTQRKVRITGYYGQRTEVPFNFIPDGIFLKLLLLKVGDFVIEQDINVDGNHINQFIHYFSPTCGCGSIHGMGALI